MADNVNGRRWVLGEAGKDLLDDCQVECLHLGPILVDREGGKVNQLTIQSYSKALGGYCKTHHLIQVSEFSC